MKKGNQQGSILPALALILIAGLTVFGYLFLGLNKDQNFITQQVIPNQSPAAQTVTSPASTAVISITGDGFTPSVITIAKGQQVVWVNKDSQAHQVTSFPKTAANALSGLTDSDVLDPNDSFSFTFENTGTFTYHDELNPSKFKGTIIVN
ncbi:hypothetical protein A3J19_04025 [Candidatus Daviesbacteria bacterium RIFCSPLOWO2_02_FULL_41_8]|uniref:EfeO-type cupredoxin-like domain-containing protein n=3 Tax=Candidatus Daviesiibacteriota TaxID=1752718 RepID=A0A1F5NLY1_9BACT|nr:MAG: hypothetical protein A2871_03955 [Candidatus Daviesbacteria bacterium RIFCSPHIGHO2_01_FULL_41_23]OGE33865.1 MAG: hypothetical protein A3D83_00465 [Candidatus Daviesbacteria bacterium RIFCSPHIGHO2_02_FULL_41_10]OGE62304.1 MAG: hypothetical protein A2967_02515 [Candidatus Daviesbacteria bacterium RIFCSPLOWO2_01_FULL_41_32]OGE78400.1 MAG: hypothetical protein A3J19_04025 [Candidatus Daviesbacteria bacterium RIFCSPLOWO2_02_FULL_41_8]